MKPQEMMDEFKEVPEVAEAVSQLEASSYTKEELEQYDRYWDVIRTKASMLHDAREEGRRIGRQQYRQEIEQKINRNVVLKGYENGISVNILSYMTRLSEEQVQEIIDKY